MDKSRIEQFLEATKNFILNFDYVKFFKKAGIVVAAFAIIAFLVILVSSIFN